jgi:transcriptional regulator with XRE-family HTH domain
MTQEDLSDGICSVSSLSKIENGSQVPSRKTYTLLMQRLGEPGYTYANFQTEKEYRFSLLTYELMDAMEYGLIERVDEKLWQMQQLVPRSDIVMQQVYRMSRQIWYHMCGVDDREYVSQCTDILAMRRSFDRLIEGIRDMKLDFVEIWVVNNVAVGHLWEQEAGMALQLLLILYQKIREIPTGTRGAWKMRGILCNNIALSLLELGRFREAETYCRKGILAMEKEGGLMQEMKLFRVKMEIEKCEGHRESYADLQRLIRSVAQVFPAGWHRQSMMADRLWEKKEILIL